MVLNIDRTLKRLVEKRNPTLPALNEKRELMRDFNVLKGIIRELFLKNLM